MAANAWFGGAPQAADVIGPVLGGAARRGRIRTDCDLAVDVATFLLGIPLLLRLPALVPICWTPTTRQLARGRAAGLRYLAGNRVAACAIGFLVLGLTCGADDVALPFLARSRLR